MTDKRRLFPLIEKVLILIVLAAVFLSLGTLRLQRPSAPDGVEQLDGWYSMQNGQRVDVELPCSLTLDGGEDLVLYNDSLSSADASNALTTRGAVYRLRILLGDQVLYAYEDSDFPRNEQMRSKLYCTASLQGDLDSQRLSLVYQNPGDGHFQLSAVYLGSSSAVFRWQASSDVFTFVTVFTMLLIGIIALGIHIYLLRNRMPDPRFANVACFLFICAVWCALDSSLIQQLTNMSPSVCYISFYAFMTLAVPMIHFVRNTGEMGRFRSLNVCLLLFYLNAAAQSLLDYFGIFCFIDMLPVTHLLLAAGIGLIAVLMLREYARTHQREILVTLIAFAILTAGGLLAILLYWLLQISYYGVIFELGIVVFIICLLCSLINTMVANLRFKSEAIVYQRLSQEDRLTGLANRRGFEKYLTNLESGSDSRGNMALLFMDLNGLKYVNDQFGHNVGDELIIAAARCIESAFSGIGTCYRVGGDEFAAILPDPEGNEEDWQKRLEDAVRLYNQDARHRLSIACGASLLRDETGRSKRLSDWKYEADQAMYACKQRQKEQQFTEFSSANQGREGKHYGI